VVSTQLIPAQVFPCHAVLTRLVFAQVNRVICVFDSRQLGHQPQGWDLSPGVPAATGTHCGSGRLRVWDFQQNVACGANDSASAGSMSSRDGPSGHAARKMGRHRSARCSDRGLLRAGLVATHQDVELVNAKGCGDPPQPGYSSSPVESRSMILPSNFREELRQPRTRIFPS
jgi:hypothetical protein